MAKCCCIPSQISAKFDSWFLALLAALTFAVATLGINVVANFVSPAFDFSNVFPRHISFKRGGYIAAVIALVLYPFAPWEGGRGALRQHYRRDDGADLGVMMVDYYLIRKGGFDVQALYQEDGEYRFQGGWHVNALIAAASAACSRQSCRTSPPAAGLVGSTAGSSVWRSAGIYYVLRRAALGARATAARA